MTQTAPSLQLPLHLAYDPLNTPRRLRGAPHAQEAGAPSSLTHGTALDRRACLQVLMLGAQGVGGGYQIRGGVAFGANGAGYVGVKAVAKGSRVLELMDVSYRRTGSVAPRAAAKKFTYDRF